MKGVLVSIVCVLAVGVAYAGPTFMVDLGFPFVILYSAVLVILFFRLIRQVFRPPDDRFFHPLVLLLPLVAAMLEFLILDGLLHPQIAWFFHLLLGLIPSNGTDSV